MKEDINHLDYYKSLLMIAEIKIKQLEKEIRKLEHDKKIVQKRLDKRK